MSGAKLVHSMPEFGEDEKALQQAMRIKQAKFTKNADGEDEDLNEDDNEEKDDGRLV